MKQYAASLILLLHVLLLYLSWQPFSHRQRMYSHVFSVLFVCFLVLSLVVRFWLGSRHIRHILAHRNAVPAQFAEKIPLAAHQKAADYTIAKTKMGLVMTL